MHAGIGTLQETSLHSDLKKWYAKPGDLVEERVANRIVDIVRGELCIEIQTRQFSSIKRKLSILLREHPVRLVYPIASERYIVRIEESGEIFSRRISPKRGRLEDVFGEVVHIAPLVSEKGFSLEILFIKEEQIWVDDGKGSWRRKGWSIADRKLVEVMSSTVFSRSEDYLSLLPQGLPLEFTVKDIIRSGRISPNLARKMAYSLRQMGILTVAGKKDRYNLYCIPG
jgi:hypothetical protein